MPAQPQPQTQIQTRSRAAFGEVAIFLLTAIFLLVATTACPPLAAAAPPSTDAVVAGGLEWLVAKQSRRGNWAANESRYPTAITALAGTALSMEGSTTSQGRYAEKHLGSISNNSFGHWHYAHFYYSQVMYREGGRKWEAYRDQVERRLVSEAQRDRAGFFWPQGYIGPAYTTATNLIILQFDKGTLPIYQR